MSVISIAKASYQLNGHKLTPACRWPCYGELSTFGSHAIDQLDELLFLEIVTWVQRVFSARLYISSRTDSSGISKYSDVLLVSSPSCSCVCDKETRWSVSMVVLSLDRRIFPFRHSSSILGRSQPQTSYLIVHLALWDVKSSFCCWKKRNQCQLLIGVLCTIWSNSLFFKNNNGGWWGAIRCSDERRFGERVLYHFVLV